MDADVLESCEQVRRAQLLPHSEKFLRRQGQCEPQLLRDREDERRDRGDVGSECVGSDAYEVGGEVDPCVPLVVLLLVDASVGFVVVVVACGECPHDVLESEPGLRRRRRQQHGGAAHPEQAEREQHGSLVPMVVEWREGFRRHDQRQRTLGHGGLG